MASSEQGEKNIRKIKDTRIKNAKKGLKDAEKCNKDIRLKKKESDMFFKSDVYKSVYEDALNRALQARVYYPDTLDSSLRHQLVEVLKESDDDTVAKCRTETADKKYHICMGFFAYSITALVALLISVFIKKIPLYILFEGNTAETVRNAAAFVPEVLVLAAALSCMCAFISIAVSYGKYRKERVIRDFIEDAFRDYDQRKQLRSENNVNVFPGADEAKSGTRNNVNVAIKLCGSDGIPYSRVVSSEAVRNGCSVVLGKEQK